MIHPNKYTMTDVNTKTIVNTLYHAAILSGLTVAYSMLAKRMLKMNTGNPANADIEDTFKLAGIIGLAEGTRTWLVSQKIIPEGIQK